MSLSFLGVFSLVGEGAGEFVSLPGAGSFPFVWASGRAGSAGAFELPCVLGMLGAATALFDEAAESTAADAFVCVAVSVASDRGAFASTDVAGVRSGSSLGESHPVETTHASTMAASEGARSNWRIMADMSPHWVEFGS
jgi:hypothetical protein